MGKPLLKGTAGKFKRNLEDSNKLESENKVDGMPAQPSIWCGKHLRRLVGLHSIRNSIHTTKN